MIDISEAADRCVMCGMCLPHCPTYNQTRNEADSPRGRIALMRALHTGQLGDGDALVEHLDGCLACRACEPVCPANVPYGDLIDSTRATLRDRRSGTFDFSKFLIGMLVTRRWPRTLAYALLLAYQRSGVENMGRKTGLLTLAGLARGQSLLPVIEPAARPRPKSTADYGRPSVALFTGCVAEIFDRTTLNASQKLLTRLGYHVSIPKHQTCCGALHLHSVGSADEARRAVDAGVDVIVAQGWGGRRPCPRRDHDDGAGTGGGGRRRPDTSHRRWWNR